MIKLASGRINLYQGDCLEVLKTLPENSVDSCVTDPPYALVSILKRFGKEGAAPAKSNGATGVYARASKGFMQATWDTGKVAFNPECWAQVLRILKPGAHLVAFGGTRTYHRLACAIEDAGFDIRDQIQWLYGQGFPKNHNSLKPANEPIVLARKPLSEPTVAKNILKWGTGGINIDECRIPAGDSVPKYIHRRERAVNCYGDGRSGSNRTGEKSNNRWPANVILQNDEEVLACFPYTKSGVISGQRNQDKKVNVYGDWKDGDGTSLDNQVSYGDAGSAARFFYHAKASSQDRLGFKHPTIKPVSLMQWLVRLITPPGGIVLDCFAGTGTTGQAALAEGFDAVLIEREDEYVANIKTRIEQTTVSTLEGLFCD